MDGLHRLRSKVAPITPVHKLISDVMEGCHLVNKDEHENIIAWAFPRDITLVSLRIIYVARLSVQKEVCSSQITDRVSPLGGHLDCSTLKLSGLLTFYITP